MAKRKGSRRRYGDCVEYLRGKMYATVNLPLGNGKYKRERKRVESEVEARQWAGERLAEHKAGGTSPIKAGDGVTFATLAAWYKVEFLVPPVYKNGRRIAGLRTYERQQTALDRISRTLGHHKLNDITIDVLRRYKAERLRSERTGVTAVNRDFALLKTMFKKARARKWMRENPFDLGEPLIEISLEASRVSVLTDWKAKKLLARSRRSEQPLLYYLILVAMNTGARPSEMFPYEAREGDGIERDPLRWSRVTEFDFKAVRLISYKGRIRKERIVPTSPGLESGLRELYERTRPGGDDLIFPQSSFKKCWDTLCRNARVKGVVLRDFRHYYNSYLVNRGFDDVSRMLLLGHANTTTNLIYSHLNEEFFRRYRETI